RASVGQGLHSDCLVRALVSDPRNPQTVYAGTDQGLYRSDDAGAKWQLMNNPMKGSAVWTVAIDPTDSNRVFAGTGTSCTPGIYRSTDGGKGFQRLDVEIAA